MDFPKYKKLVNELEFGKKLPDAVYLHKSYISSLPHELAKFVCVSVSKHDDDFDWNVLKLYRRDFKVTVLAYPGFDEISYPPLNASLTIDLVRSSVRHTNFSESTNPPILHRKETLVPESYEHYGHFVVITQEGETAGLYENNKTIGFRKSWERAIASKGYALVNGHLIRRNEWSKTQYGEDDQKIQIQRHLTAVDRDRLSTPMQSLARHGYFEGDHSILDYGCGKGNDLVELEAHGLDATGWDPAYRLDGEKRPSDIVNLGFVINVIEDRAERTEALTTAYSLANKLLVVAVMLGGESTTQKFKPYKDGVVTSRGTFQKYFTQAELRDYVETTLEQRAVAVGPGLFYIFKDELEEQEFLVRRQRIKREWRQLVKRDRLSPSVDHQAVIDKNLELFRDFWATCLDFGRPPANDEFDRSDEIRRVIGSHRKALNASMEYFGNEDYQAARVGRKKDLTVFLALSFFDQHRAYSRMPISLQRDIRAFFEKPSKAYDFAKEALFAIADTEMIHVACENAFEKLGCGHFEVDHSYTLLADLLDRLPPILRIYVACATQLYGDIDTVHLIKIHINSGKVSLMIYDDFEKPLPILKERVKIRMRDLDVDFFNYSVEHGRQVLYEKHVYLTGDEPGYEEQLAFDKQLREAGIDFANYGPSLDELTRQLGDLPNNLLSRLAN